MQVSAKGTTKPAPASKQTSGGRVRMRDRNTDTRRENVEGHTEIRGDMAQGDYKEDVLLLNKNA